MIVIVLRQIEIIGLLQAFQQLGIGHPAGIEVVVDVAAFQGFLKAGQFGGIAGGDTAHQFGAQFARQVKQRVEILAAVLEKAEKAHHLVAAAIAVAVIFIGGGVDRRHAQFQRGDEEMPPRRRDERQRRDVGAQDLLLAAEQQIMVGIQQGMVDEQRDAAEIFGQPVQVLQKLGGGFALRQPRVEPVKQAGAVVHDHHGALEEVFAQIENRRRGAHHAHVFTQDAELIRQIAAIFADAALLEIAGGDDHHVARPVAQAGQDGAALGMAVKREMQFGVGDDGIVFADADIAEMCRVIFGGFGGGKLGRAGCGYGLPVPIRVREHIFVITGPRPFGQGGERGSENFGQGHQISHMLSIFITCCAIRRSGTGNAGRQPQTSGSSIFDAEYVTPA